ncbi:hypothetical protein [Indiicoccus explosivorum]|uniref:hypothetical protein n=1 Tax=Indiicoccus explosivorum TaxID=1917864 RepID=UPI000B4461FF|nr:hypothetical protein [Indiicoccus explosivorum]
MKNLVSLLTAAIFLAACGGPGTLEEAYEAHIEQLGIPENNFLVTLHEQADGGYAVFWRKEDGKETYNVSWFDQTEDGWNWARADDCNAQWSVYAGVDKPYLYCGLLPADTDQVFIGEQEAQIVKIDDGRKIWFGRSETADPVLTAVTGSSTDVLNETKITEEDLSELQLPRDFIKYDGRLYTRTPEEFIGENEIESGKKYLIGEIQEKADDPKGADEFSAGALRVGTAIYSPNPKGEFAGVLIAETPVGDFQYRYLPEE